MRQKFRDLPLRRKLTLIAVVTTMIALSVAGVAALGALYVDSRAEFANRHSILAQLTADNSTASLAFNDRHQAAQILETLTAAPSIIGAQLTDADGKIVATYLRTGYEASAEPEHHSGEPQLFDSGALHVWAPVSEADRELGILYLRADLTDVYSRIRLAAILLFVLAAVGCTMASVLAARMQQSISRPIVQLAEISESVREEQTWVLRPRVEAAGNDEVGRLVHSFNRMLDEIHEREVALRESESNFRMLTEQASDGIAITDGNRRILSFNETACKLVGMTHEEVIGLDMQELGLDDDGVAQPQLVEQLRAGKSLLAERRVRRRDGSRVWVETNTKMMEDGRIQVILRDLSERRQLEGQLRHSQKMDAVGQLAGGVAHDFNNLLTVIGGFSEQIMDNPAAAVVRSEAAEILSASDRAATLTRQLLAFSRQQVLSPVSVRLTSTIESLDRMLRRLIGEDIEFVTRLAPDLGIVKVDVGQFEQVILNLVVNARDAMPQGGHITLWTENVEHIATGDTDDDMPSGSYVALFLEDTGYGIDSDSLPHIFEPFFTTKEAGKGTGLGLSTLYGIVKQSGGFATVKTEVGVGTRFSIYLPRTFDSPVAGSPDATKQAPITGQECILLVEDEDAVRRFTQVTLASLGYTVLEAKDATEAIAVSQNHEGKIDLLLSDLIMPGSRGDELAREIRALRPETRVLIMTGYAGDVLDRRNGLGDYAVLIKPFGVQILSTRIREILDGDITEQTG